jgi:hypothetical protein
MHEIKTHIKRELKHHEASIEAKGCISSMVLERIHLLTDTYKNICKIEHYDPEFYEEIEDYKGRSYSSEEVKEMMEKLYAETEHTGDKAIILKMIKSF